MKGKNMSIFLEVLAQAGSRLKQMSQQMENIRWMAENDRYDAALEQALRLEYNSEKLTLLTRALPGYTGNPVAKAYVEKAMAEAIPVEMGYTAEGWFSLRLPMLLPRKNQGSADYIRSCLYPAMRRFFQDKPPVHYPDCVLIFRHVYSRDRPERERRDHDNIEVNIVADIVALYTLPDDNPNVCNHYYCSAAAEKERTEVYVVPKADFQKWLDVEKTMPDKGVELLQELPGSGRNRM